jgi:hypothetical protein
MTIPQSSTGQGWLNLQHTKRQQSAEIVALEAKKWFGLNLPESAYENFAERVVAALDQRL